MGYGQRLEIHYGLVTDNEDPEKLGRVRVQCETLTQAGGEVPYWIPPVHQFLAASDDTTVDAGMLFVPSKGVIVELIVVVSGGSDELPGFSSMVAPDIKYRGATRARGEDGIPSLFETNYPNRRGLTTAAGHVLMFDDTPDDLKVELSWNNGTDTSFVSFDKEGSLIMATGPTANLIQMNAKDGGITLLDSNQNILDMNSGGLYLGTADSDLLQMGGGEVSILTGTHLVNCTNVKFEAGEFIVSQFGLETPVIVEGVLGFQALLASSLIEIAGLIGGLGLVAATTTGVVVPALQAGAFSSLLTSTE